MKPFTLGPTAKAAFLCICAKPGLAAREIRDSSLPDNEVGHVRAILNSLSKRGVIVGAKQENRTVTYSVADGASEALVEGERDAARKRRAREEGEQPRPMVGTDFTTAFRRLAHLDMLIYIHTGSHNRAKASGTDAETHTFILEGETLVVTLGELVKELRARRKELLRQPGFKVALEDELAKTLTVG